MTRLEKNARRVIKELIGSLQRDLVSVRTDANLRQGQDSANEVTPDLEQDNDDLAPLVDQLRDHFENATREWNELVQAFEEVRSEIAESAFESVFGGLFEEVQEDAGRESEAREVDARGPRTPDTPPPSAGAAVDDGEPEDDDASANVSAARDEEDETPTDEAVDDEDSVRPRPDADVLEEKLDDLLLLVRDHVAKRGHGDRHTSIPKGWTHRIAKDVAQRLRESMSLSPQSTSAGSDGASEKAASTTSKRISIDDVAAMIDEITGRNC